MLVLPADRLNLAPCRIPRHLLTQLDMTFRIRFAYQCGGRADDRGLSSSTANRGTCHAAPPQYHRQHLAAALAWWLSLELDPATDSHARGVQARLITEWRLFLSFRWTNAMPRRRRRVVLVSAIRTMSCCPSAP